MSEKGYLRGIIDTDKPGGYDDLALIIGAMLALYVVYAGLGILLGYDVNGIVNTLRRITFLTAVYGLVVLALNLQWGYAGLFNIGVIGYMAVGVYTMAIVTAPANPTGAGAIPGLGMPLIVGIIVGMLVTGFVGFLTALPALRLRADYLAIVTIGISEIIRFTIKSTTLQEFTIFGQTLGTGGGSGFGLATDPETVVVDAFLRFDGALGNPITGFGESLGVEPTVVEGWMYAIFLVIMVAAFYWLLRRVANSPFGRVLRAIKEDEDATNSLGKNTPRFKIKAFMLGTALMGLAGMLWMGSQGFLNPAAFRPEMTFFIWIAIIIGGAGSNTGSVLGGALFAGLLFEGPRFFQQVMSKTFDFGQTPVNVVDAVGGFGDLVHHTIILGPAQFPLPFPDLFPFMAYVLSQMSPIRLILTGVVLIYVMQNRPQGLLGHRKEPAAAIPILGTRPGGEEDE